MAYNINRNDRSPSPQPMQDRGDEIADLFAVMNLQESEESMQTALVESLLSSQLHDEELAAEQWMSLAIDRFQQAMFNEALQQNTAEQDRQAAGYFLEEWSQSAVTFLIRNLAGRSLDTTETQVLLRLLLSAAELINSLEPAVVHRIVATWTAFGLLRQSAEIDNGAALVNELKLTEIANHFGIMLKKETALGLTGWHFYQWTVLVYELQNEFNRFLRPGEVNVLLPLIQHAQTLFANQSTIHVQRAMALLQQAGLVAAQEQAPVLPQSRLVAYLQDYRHDRAGEQERPQPQADARLDANAPVFVPRAAQVQAPQIQVQQVIQARQDQLAVAPGIKIFANRLAQCFAQERQQGNTGEHIHAWCQALEAEVTARGNGLTLGELETLLQGLRSIIPLCIHWNITHLAHIIQSTASLGLSVYRVEQRADYGDINRELFHSVRHLQLSTREFLLNRLQHNLTTRAQAISLDDLLQVLAMVIALRDAGLPDEKYIREIANTVCQELFSRPIPQDIGTNVQILSLISTMMSKHISIPNSAKSLASKLFPYLDRQLSEIPTHHYYDLFGALGILVRVRPLNYRMLENLSNHLLAQAVVRIDELDHKTLNKLLWMVSQFVDKNSNKIRLNSPNTITLIEHISQVVATQAMRPENLHGLIWSVGILLEYCNRHHTQLSHLALKLLKLFNQQIALDSSWTTNQMALHGIYNILNTQMTLGHEQALLLPPEVSTMINQLPSQIIQLVDTPDSAVVNATFTSLVKMLLLLNGKVSEADLQILTSCIDTLLLEITKLTERTNKRELVRILESLVMLFGSNMINPEIYMSCLQKILQRSEENIEFINQRGAIALFQVFVNLRPQLQLNDTLYIKMLATKFSDFANAVSTEDRVRLLEACLRYMQLPYIALTAEQYQTMHRTITRLYRSLQANRNVSRTLLNRAREWLRN